MQTGR